MDKNTPERGPVLAEIWDGFRARALRSPTAAAERDRRRAVRIARHAERTAHRNLEHELASFISAADFNDLDAIVKRYGEEETEDIRSILAARRAA